jgi:hypothetical protein
MRWHTWFVALFFSGVTAALAGELSRDDRDQARAAKADAPGPFHQNLSGMAGNWDVAINYKLGDKVREGTASCEAKWILDGRFLQQDYTSQFQGKPYHVVQLIGYDNNRKKTIEIKLDNLSTGIMHNEGSISADGRIMTNQGESLDSATGKPFKLRTVTTIVDTDHFTLEWFHVVDESKAERVVTMSHTRKKSSPRGIRGCRLGPLPLEQHHQPVSHWGTEPSCRAEKTKRPD